MVQLLWELNKFYRLGSLLGYYCLCGQFWVTRGVQRSNGHGRLFRCPVVIKAPARPQASACYYLELESKRFATLPGKFHLNMFDWISYSLPSRLVVSNKYYFRSYWTIGWGSGPSLAQSALRYQKHFNKIPLSVAVTISVLIWNCWRTFELCRQKSEKWT